MAMMTDTELIATKVQRVAACVRVIREAGYASTLRRTNADPDR